MKTLLECFTELAKNSGCLQDLASEDVADGDVRLKGLAVLGGGVRPLVQFRNQVDVGWGDTVDLESILLLLSQLYQKASYLFS